MRVQQRRRDGATLIEVLVAIFVMALGLIALLTLFPLGALRMAKAIQDDRAALTGSNASASLNAKALRFDPEIVIIRDAFGAPIGGKDPFVGPTPLGTDMPFYSGPRTLDPNGPSFPALVDPVGYLSLNPTTRHWAGNLPGVLSRRNVSFAVGSKSNAFYWFNLLDDITFQRDLASPYTMGSPSVIPINTLEREYRYTWAYSLQRPRLMETGVVDASVVVFKERPTGFTTENTLREFQYDANPALATINPLLVSNTWFDTTANTVRIDYSNSTPPPLRIGSWILDCSYGPAWPPGSPAPHATWYRVVNVVKDDLVNMYMEVELQTPLRGFPANTTSPGTVLVFDGVVEVFERGPGREQ